MKTKIQYLVL